MDPFDDLYARVIVEHALDVGPGDTVLVESSTLGEPLADAVHRRVLAAGGVPFVRLVPAGLADARLECATDRVLASPDFGRELAYAHVDRRVNILAEANTRGTSDYPAERVALASRGRHRTLEPLMRRDAAGEASWCAAQYPTQAYAQEAGISLDEYRGLLARALLLDQADPVLAWRRAAQRQEALCRFLGGVDELRFRAEGTDLRLRVGGRRWISAHGTHNLPDGEVFTGPHEDSAEGTVRFSFPAVWEGRAVLGAELRFEAGRVVEARADAGEDLLLAALDLDDGARRVGEIALGLNDGVDRSFGDTLLDEKIGGSFHLALGSSYVETGGVNESDLHWDLVCDLRQDGEIHADGEVVYRAGRFLEGRVPA